MSCRRREVAPLVRHILPAGVDAALELVGTPTLPDTLAATRIHGTVCFTGMLSNQWTVPNFYPIAYLPKGVRLAAYGGESEDLPAAVLQGYLDKIASGTLKSAPHAYTASISTRSGKLTPIWRTIEQLANSSSVSLD